MEITESYGALQNLTEAKIDGAQMMKDNVKIAPISNEQNKVIEKLEEVLLFLKSTPIKNDEALISIKRPLNQLQSNLKYLPTEQSFNNFPAEIKRKTLDYLCDSHAFTSASVCQEWKEIFESRFTELAVTIGKRCCAKNCRDHRGFRRSEKACQMLKALATHRMDVDLSITHPIKQIDSKIVTQALTSVSKLTISSEENCTCQYGDGDDSDSGECECDLNPLTLEQLQDLFRALEKKDGIVEKVKLEALDLTDLDQDSLANCFMNKIKNLTLEGVTFKEEIFFRKLSEEPTEFQLTSLILNSLVDFRSLINREGMERLFNKMVKLQLKGNFTWAQVVAVNDLPDVKVSIINDSMAVIQKGF